MSKVLKERIITVLSIFLSVGVILGSLLISAAVLVKNTVYSKAFYEKVTMANNYIPMLNLAIKTDLLAQSSYVAVPIENLSEGLSDEKLKSSLKNHTDNVVGFLTYKTEFKKASYSEDEFYTSLESFINADGVENDYKPSEEQYELLREVAKDSSEIVTKHVNILNLDLVKNVFVFKQLQHFIFNVRDIMWPAIGLLIGSLLLLALLHRKNLSRALLFGASGIWIFGTLLLIPTLVLEVFGITRRLSIQTGYLKFAIDTWLTNANHMAMGIGLVVFLISTAVLVGRIVFGKENF